jgi:hypothetical protein
MATELCIVDVLCLYSTYTQWPHDESTEAEVHILEDLVYARYMYTKVLRGFIL